MYIHTYHRFALAQSVACDGQLLSPDAGPQDSLRSRLCSDSSIGPGEERAAAAQPYYRERIRRGRQTDRAGQARAYACRHASESVGRRSSRQTDKTDKTDKTGNQAVGQEAPSSLTDSRSSLPCLKLMKLNVLHREHTCHIYQTAIQPSNNAIFLSHLYIKTIISPRQARDKHRENSKKDALLQGPTSRGLLCLRSWRIALVHTQRCVCLVWYLLRPILV